MLTAHCFLFLTPQNKCESSCSTEPGFILIEMIYFLFAICFIVMSDSRAGLGQKTILEFWVKAAHNNQSDTPQKYTIIAVLINIV